jgi:hypothetical protein
MSTHDPRSDDNEPADRPARATTAATTGELAGERQAVAAFRAAVALTLTLKPGDH